MFRNYNDMPLTLDQVRHAAPSVFASAPRGDVSDKYAFISTEAIVDKLLSDGWSIFGAGQSRVRNRVDGEFYAKHVLRLRHTDKNLVDVGDCAAEVILTNSHDRSSGFSLLAGLYRLVCSNGMTVSDGVSEKISVRHLGGETAERVVEGVYTVISDLPKIGDKVKEFSEIMLTPEEENAYASAALKLRWDNAPVVSNQLLNARRSDDKGSDLWRVFNRVQENIVRGGLRGHASTGRKTTTRAIKSVNADLKFNRALFALTEEMAKLKAA